MTTSNGLVGTFDVPQVLREGTDMIFTWRERRLAVRVSGFYQHTSGALDATVRVLSVNPLTAEQQGLLLLSRVNLLGPNHQRDVVRELQSVNDHLIDWRLAVKYVFSQAWSLYNTPPAAVNLRHTDLEQPLTFLFDPLVAEDELTVFYGDGSSLKSYLAQMLAVSAATGVPVGPFVPTRTCRVLVLDWETRQAVVRRRLRRICAGIGVEPPDFHYLWMEQGLVHAGEHVRREIDRLGIDLVVMDSIAPALGGDVKAELVLPFISAVRRLGERVTKVLISHISAESATNAANKKSRPFGSVFVRNLARSTWEFKRTAKEGRDAIILALSQEKVNEGPEEVEPLGLRVRFDGREGPVTCQPVSSAEAPSLRQRLSLGKQVVEVLGSSGWLETNDVAEALGVTQSVARTTLNRMVGDGVLVRRQERDTERNTTVSLWAVTTRDYPEADRRDAS